MSDTALIEAGGFPLWAVRRAGWFLVAVHLPFVAYIVLTVISRHPDAPVGGLALATLAAVAAGGLQLRHSLAAARRQRPAAWPLSFAALVVLTYLPAWWFGRYWVDWFPVEFFFIASAAMLLPRRLAVPLVTVVIVATSVGYGIYDRSNGFGYPQVVLFFLYYVAALVMFSGALYASARLVAILGELFAVRTERAEDALANERVRMSRDLHDLLGHSLSAVSLKADLAIRLLPSDPVAAHQEIESLTGVARSALRDMRAVARDQHVVSLPAEAASALAVLEAAGVRTRVATALLGLSPGLEAVFAWGVREGTTNILRHSQATAAAITTCCEDGIARLEIVNDGAQPSAGEGNGLAGLAGRANVLGGTATGGYAGGGAFRLCVEIPVNAR